MSAEAGRISPKPTAREEGSSFPTWHFKQSLSYLNLSASLLRAPFPAHALREPLASANEPNEGP